MSLYMWEIPAGVLSELQLCITVYAEDIKSAQDRIDSEEVKAYIADKAPRIVADGWFCSTEWSSSVHGID